MPSSHLILCGPLLLPPVPLSIRVFSNESTFCIRWPKYWSFSLSISPSNEHPGLISFRMDWLDLLAVQGTLKSFLQHHSSKASILRCSAFFTVQLSHPYTAAGKTIAMLRILYTVSVVYMIQSPDSSPLDVHMFVLYVCVSVSILQIRLSIPFFKILFLDINIYLLISVQFICSVVSDSLQLHGLQHVRPPYPSPTPSVYSNPCPLSR